MTDQLLSALGCVEEKYVLPYAEKVGEKRSFTMTARRWVALAAALAIVITGGILGYIRTGGILGYIRFSEPVYPESTAAADSNYKVYSRDFDTLGELLGGSSPASSPSHLTELGIFRKRSGVRFRKYWTNGNYVAMVMGEAYEMRFKRNGVRAQVVWLPEAGDAAALPKEYSDILGSFSQTTDAGGVAVSFRQTAKETAGAFRDETGGYIVITRSGDFGDFTELIEALTGKNE